MGKRPLMGSPITHPTAPLCLDEDVTIIGAPMSDGSSTSVLPLAIRKPLFREQSANLARAVTSAFEGFVTARLRYSAVHVYSTTTALAWAVGRVAVGIPSSPASYMQHLKAAFARTPTPR